MIRNLVISGGGIKIISLIGVIKYLEEHNILSHISNFYGTSAGSILSLLIILNYTSSEIINFIESFNLDKIFIINIDDFFDNLSICNNFKFKKLIKLFIKFKVNNENINLNDLFLITNKNLTITSVSLKLKKPLYINHLTHPDLPVYKAIMMSCSIPFIFKPIKWKDDYFIDGGVLDNFPLFNINTNEIKYTLGLDTNIVSNNTQLNESFNIDSFNMSDYVFNIIKILMESKPNNKSYNVINVQIDSNIINNILDINIDKNTKNKLINEGYKQCSSILPTLFNNKVVDASTQTDILKSVKRRSNSI